MRPWHESRSFALAYRFRGICVFLLGCLGIAAMWQNFAPSRILWSLMVLLAGLGLRLWARRHIGLHSRGKNLEAPYRAVGGPYRIFPHPLYLANSLVALGLVGVGIPVAPALMAAFPVFLFYAALGFGESRYLRRAGILVEKQVIASPGWLKEGWSILPPLMGWLLLARGFPAWGLR